MTAREMKAWERDRVLNGPPGPKRPDYLAAHLCQAVLAAGGVKKENDESFTLEDCLLNLKTERAKSPEEIEQQSKLRVANELQALVGRFR